MAHEFCRELLKEEKKHNSISIRAAINGKMPALNKSGDPQFDVIIYHVAEPNKILKQEWVKACCAYYAKSEVLGKCRDFFTKEWYDKQPA